MHGERKTNRASIAESVYFKYQGDILIGLILILTC
jgi:hypothetical protein